MKTAILGDIHFSIRNGHPIFQQNIRKFFSDLFFPYLKKHGIKKILQTGDMFDSRKANNNLSIVNARECFFTPMVDDGIECDVIVGNHDMHYLHKISPNSLEIYCQEYDNITIHCEPRTVKVGNKTIDMIPWICDENREDIINFMRKSTSDFVFGHFEINGFEMTKGHYCENGLDVSLFSKYKRVWSGHFHKKSKVGNIEYFGSPSQHNWDDLGEARGFHVYDDETDTMEFIENPYNLYERIQYTDLLRAEEQTQISGKYVKVILPEEYDVTKFKKFMDELWLHNPIDIKSIESVQALEGMDISLEDIESMSFSMVDFLTQYTVNNNPDLDESELRQIYEDLYVESMKDE